MKLSQKHAGVSLKVMAVCVIKVNAVERKQVVKGKEVEREIERVIKTRNTHCVMELCRSSSVFTVD